MKQCKILFDTQKIAVRETGMNLGYDKCYIIIFNKLYLSENDKKIIDSNDLDININLDQKKLKIADNIEVLGSDLSSTKTIGLLNHNEHINNMINSSEKQANYLYIIGVGLIIKNMEITRNVSNAIIESRLLYSTRSVLHSKSNNKKIMIAQSKFIKRSLGLYDITNISNSR